MLPSTTKLRLVDTMPSNTYVQPDQGGLGKGLSSFQPHAHYMHAILFGLHGRLLEKYDNSCNAVYVEHPPKGMYW